MTTPEHAPILPVIAAEMAVLAPGFRALSLTVEAAPIVRPEIADRAVERACRALARGEPDWAETHLAAWAKVFRHFGAKPRRTPCSAEALRKRALRDDGLPSTDPVVDLYNAISVQFAIPVGGENLATYANTPRLVVADDSETFDALKNSEALDESPDPGEIVWRDDLGVTCYRWSWRQGVCTRLDASARRMWFILESLPEMLLAALHEMGGPLLDELCLMMPGMRADSRLPCVATEPTDSVQEPNLRGEQNTYLPSHSEESGPQALHASIRDCPLDLLVSHGEAGLDANHLPSELSPEKGAQGAPEVHVAHNNPVWSELRDGDEVLVVFRAGSAHISPQWYPSKQEHHRQMPTWNYRMVHAHGRVRIRDDQCYVCDLVARLTRTHEATQETP